MTASKDTQGKPDLSLIPYCVEVELARAMMYGEKKYGRYNYTKGHALSQLVAAMKRHLGKFLAGEEMDPESGVSHLGHVMAGCLMVIHQKELGTLKDDRLDKPARVCDTKKGQVIQCVDERTGQAEEYRMQDGTCVRFNGRPEINPVTSEDSTLSVAGA